ncbi:NADH-quinone oxidoreductase subunit N [Acuticoccus sp. MNP-M23]|uniref:NADH-quinone oxidoreductase subunit N n=1 Tax=Acuticoccus sp. MNP-M23 TaxID=3072793 RepID=UPI0028164701|nr:NADH-quinone oxidoreductase subunit N [Acuticoccus sp. MNP-M23]WMS44415.1 NADH-quinone oxidoreductase subunit N [Acuticoccus sp. MNP-M23]
MPVGDIVPEIAVIVTAVVALLTASFVPHRLHSLAAVIALAGIAFAAVLLSRQIGTSTLTFSGTWVIDGASVWSRLMILLSTAVVVLMALRWFQSDRRHGEFYFVLLVAMLGAMALAGAADLLQLVIAVLLSSVTGYTLAAYHRNWPLSLEAGMKYFLVGALANAVLVLGVALVYGMVGTTSYDGMAEALATTAHAPLLLLGTGLILVGLLFKLGAVPAHAWLPDVAEGAPAPAAAFLTVVPKIGAAIALARFVDLFPPDAFAVRPLIAIAAFATMTLGNLAALGQSDVRRLLGWSSVSQSGYVLMAVAVVGLTNLALPAILLFMLGYAAANLAAFAAVTHLRGRTDLSDYAGLATSRPWIAVALAVALLSLVGIPPLAGFVGKLALFLATIEAGYAWLAVAAAMNTVASLYYYLKIVGRTALHAKPAGGTAVLSVTSGVALWSSLAAVLAFGLLAELTVRAFAGGTLLP